MYFILFIIKRKNCRNESSQRMGSLTTKETKKKRNQTKKRKNKWLSIINLAGAKGPSQHSALDDTAKEAAQCVSSDHPYEKCSYLNL